MKAIAITRNEFAQKLIDACDEMENDIYWTLIGKPMSVSMVATAPVRTVRSIAERIVKHTVTTKEF